MQPSRFALFLSILLLPLGMAGQSPSWSPHRDQMEQFGQGGELETERDYDRMLRIVARGNRNTAQKCVLRQQVYGWHPYWQGTSYENYDFGLLSTVSYFGCEVDPQTGLPADLHQWLESRMVELAHQRGSRAELTAFLYGRERIKTLLGDTLRQQKLADTLVQLVRAKDADGICLDFQGVDAAMALEYGRFVRRMIISLRKADPGYELSLVLPALDQQQGYDAGVLAPYVDRFIVAAYGYRGADAGSTGPVAPLEDGAGSGGSTRSSLQRYLAQGAPKEKLLLGLPTYGYLWTAQSTEPGAAPMGNGRMVVLSQFLSAFQHHPLQWDSLSQATYKSWKEGEVAYQLWVDEFRSLRQKIRHAKDEAIGGIGVWALPYDQGSDVFWETVRDQCADCDAAGTQRYNERTKVLDGPTSAERNVDNWIWILVGMVGLLVILFFVRRMK